MEKGGFTKNNAEIMVEWNSDFRKVIFTFPSNRADINGLLETFKGILILLPFVLIFHFLGWVEAVLFLSSFILLYFLEKRNKTTSIQNLSDLVYNNSTYFNSNPILTSQNQDSFISSWSSILKEETEGTLGEERIPQYVYIDIHGAEITELRREVIEIKEKLEQKEDQEIFPIEFLESEKLTLKRPITVRAVYSPDTNTWVVDHFELDIYGEGRDIKEAVEDFKIALEESYFSLKKDKEKLSPRLQKEWERLNEILEEK